MAEWQRDTTWRQGRLLTPEAVQALGLLHPTHPAETLVIVASHDCDIAQSIASEPRVELLVGRRLNTLDLDGNFTHAKAARTLHIGFAGDAPVLAEFVATAKYSIGKELLGDFQPAEFSRLSPAGQATFQRWLAARYHRSAFPDEFERRLVRETKLAERIAKAVKPHGELITAVLFDVDEGVDLVRNGPHDVYLLDITLLHATEPDFAQAEAAANTAKRVIQSDFERKLFDAQTGQWQSIELRYLDVMSEEALTYRQFTLLKRWRLDHLSLGAEPQQPLLAE